tara:strand:+ start:4 stop:462 length:459 start_codon:yes stop_codon:yes gene_type:complete
MVTSAVSKEDGNQSSSIIGSSIRKNSDIDLLFTPKRSTVSGETGDIFKKIDAAAVKQSVKNIIMTNHFEKPFNPLFGGNVTAQLFELADNDIREDLKDDIEEALLAYEPRARVQDVVINYQPDVNSISVRIEFQVVNLNQTEVIETTIARLR